MRCYDGRHRVGLASPRGQRHVCNGDMIDTAMDFLISALAWASLAIALIFGLSMVH